MEDKKEQEILRNTLYRCDSDGIAKSVDLDQQHMLDLGKTAERTQENGTLKLGLYYADGR